MDRVFVLDEHPEPKAVRAEANASNRPPGRRVEL